MNLNKIYEYFYPYHILDIGANIGQFHNLAKHVFPESLIFSIEANQECEPFLKQITDNYYIGLLAKDNSEYDFFCVKNNLTGTGNSIYRELTHHYNDDNLTVIKQKGITLDTLFNHTYNFELIKIDTQGSEIDIIVGGIDLCLKSKAILLEVSLKQYNQGAPLYTDVIKFMDSIGFRPVEILDEVNIPGIVHQQDILFLNTKIGL